MTHGVISHNADLFYWGQSGAINESLADIMGEIIDHRHPSPGDSPHSWALGEDLPIGAVRSMKNPGQVRAARLHDQPALRAAARPTTAACTPTAASATARST